MLVLQTGGNNIRTRRLRRGITLGPPARLQDCLQDCLPPPGQISTREWGHYNHRRRDTPLGQEVTKRHGLFKMHPDLQRSGNLTFNLERHLDQVGRFRFGHGQLAQIQIHLGPFRSQLIQQNESISRIAGPVTDDAGYDITHFLLPGTDC